MIEVGLLHAVTALITEAVKEIRVGLPANYTVRRPGSLNQDDTVETEEVSEGITGLNVFEGIFPPKDNETDQFPYVMVSFDGGSANMLSGISTVNIRTTVGVYAPDSRGYLDAMNIMRLIMNALADLPDNILDGKYNLDHTVNAQWEPAADQNYPFYVAYLVTTWNHVSPKQTLKDVDECLNL